MLDMKILKRALLVGVVLEIVLVACGWARPSFRPALLFACMLTAAVAGMLYARDAGRGFLPGMLGGAMVGAASGVVAVAGATWLGEEPETFIPYGVMVMMLTGTVGGVFGELDARLRAYIVRKLTGKPDS
jgi:Na+/proline symporter